MKHTLPFPAIDMETTRRNLRELLEGMGLSVLEVQAYLAPESPSRSITGSEGAASPVSIISAPSAACSV